MADAVRMGNTCSRGDQPNTSVGFIVATSRNQVPGKNMLTGSDWGSCDAIWGQEEIFVQTPTVEAEAVWCSAGLEAEITQEVLGKQGESCPECRRGELGTLVKMRRI